MISVDNRSISSLKSAEEVQILLRYGTNLVLRKRDAIISQYIKRKSLSPEISNIATTSTATTTFLNPQLSSLPPESSKKNRSHSMDRISDITRKVYPNYLQIIENF